MVEHAIELENSLPEDGRFDRIRDLWNITEDRVHVEVLRARLTRKLCDIYVQNGDVEGAARTIQKIQIETFGSVPQNEKVDFILEQMRLSIEIADFTNATILSKKINLKYFEKKDKDNDKRFQQKVAFYQRMIQCYMHEKNYLEISKQYQHIYNTEEIKSDNAVWPDILRNVALYVILAPFSNEQSDLIHHIINEPRLDDLKLAPPGNHLSLLDVAKGFIQPELLDWEYVLKFYTPTLQSTPVFSQDTEEGRVRWEEFRSRVREHNTRVVAKYYTTVTLDRLAELVGFSATNVQEIEPFLSDLIIKDMIYARIDRPKGIVSFIRPQSTEDQLNAWSNNIDELLKLVESTTHLLSKEETGRELSKATV
ncbi:proteasome regulatory particle subunit [Mycoemilia scoparia]|uniref:Proteasome regulatory particle subunit n=1 Tax=Mycoemilia scoparia TaxID=417184 RepID=A0A9W8DL95_9FUNG|nr:proteasome regulatory particle subunit [Mycoemilia scoparia]